MFGRVIAPIAQAGQAGGTGPTGVSIATSASGNYDGAVKIARVGTAVVYFEDGSNFSGAVVDATVSEGDFSSARDRSIGFAAYARATTSGGGMTFDWTVTEVNTFSTGSLTADAENTAQDLTGLAVPSPPTGRPDTSTGLGPYVLFTGPPSVGETGKYTIALDVTDSNGTTSATTLTLNIEFGI